jgi:putative ABC transport system substrate-binding protein
VALASALKSPEPLTFSTFTDAWTLAYCLPLVGAAQVPERASESGSSDQTTEIRGQMSEVRTYRVLTKHYLQELRRFLILVCRSVLNPISDLRLLIATLSTVLAALCVSAEAQPTKRLPRIGWLSAASSSAEFPEKQALEGLRELGWAEGKNVIVEYRYAAGNPERLSQYASELVSLNVDVIVTFSAGVAAAKRASGNIPIVMGTSQDPVRTGFVASLARPGGNLTGMTFLTDDLSGKRLELLKESIPGVARTAVLWESSHVDNEFKGMREAAPKLGVQLHSLEVPRPARPDEVEKAVQTALEVPAEALVIAPSGFTILNRKRIIDLAAKHRLPAISAWRIFAEDGAILTYGPELETARRIAYYVDKILKGAKPADLPVEQPTKFELVINLKTAKQIGLTIPPSVLARADKLIR